MPAYLRTKRGELIQLPDQESAYRVYQHEGTMINVQIEENVKIDPSTTTSCLTSLCIYRDGQSSIELNPTTPFSLTRKDILWSSHQFVKGVSSYNDQTQGHQYISRVIPVDEHLSIEIMVFYSPDICCVVKFIGVSDDDVDLDDIEKWQLDDVRCSDRVIVPV